MKHRRPRRGNRDLRYAVNARPVPHVHPPAAPSLALRACRICGQLIGVPSGE